MDCAGTTLLFFHIVQAPDAPETTRLRPVCRAGKAGAIAAIAPHWSLDINEPQRGSVPKPNVVPRLRDYVGLTCQHDGNTNGVEATFTNVSIITGHLVSPT